MLIQLCKKPIFFITLLLCGVDAEAQEPKLILPFSPGIVSNMKFSPDGKRILTQADNKKGTLTSPLLWNTQTGKLLAVLSGHTGEVREAIFSPDSKKIISYSFIDDNRVRLWDAISGRVLYILGKHEVSIDAAAFSPDSKKVAIIISDTIQVWDTETGQLINSIDEFGGLLSTCTISFSPDGKKLLTTTKDSIAQVWDVETGKDIVTLSGQGHVISSASFSPDGLQVLTISEDTVIRVLNAQSGKVLHRLGGYKGGIKFARFSPDGKKIYSATIVTPFMPVKHIKIWSAEMGILLLNKKIESSTSPVFAISNDGTKIVTGFTDQENKIILQDIESEKVVGEFNNSAEISSVTLSTDNKKIATGSWDENVHIWNLETGSLITTLNGHTLEAGSALQSADGERIISQRDWEAVQIWNRRTGALLSTIYDANFIEGSDVLSPDGKRLILKIIENPSKKPKPFTPGTTSIEVHSLFTKLMRGNAELWEPDSAKFIGFLGQGKETVRARFSADSKLLFTTNEDGVTTIRNGLTGDSLFSIKQDRENAAVNFSPDSKKIAASVDKIIKVFNCTSGALLFTFKDHKEAVQQVVFTPDGKKLVTSSRDAIKIWDAASGLLQKSLIHGEEGNPKIQISPNSKLMSVRSEDKLDIWDLDGGEQITHMKDDYPSVLHEDNKMLVFSPDEKLFAFLAEDNSVLVFETHFGLEKVRLPGHPEPISSIIFSKDSKSIAVVFPNFIEVWNAETGERIDPVSQPEPIQFFDNNFYNSKRVSLNNGLVVVSDLETGKQIYSFVGVDSTEFFYQLPSGYYYISSPQVAKMLHYVTPDQRVIGFEQLDVKFNRPDLILPVIGSTDTALIDSYRKAYEKRIKKLRIDTASFSVGFGLPEADFSDRAKIVFEQRENKLSLNIKGKDAVYELDRFNLWINEVPLFGQRGISLKNKMKKVFDTTITVILSGGNNQLETSISNVNGTESYRVPLTVNYIPEVKPKEQIYFIGIGIDQFVQSKYNLKYSTKDIRDLANKLKEKYTGIIIDTLFNENVTISNVKALKQKLLQTNVNDKVIISYSGHGMLSKDFDYYLSTYGVNFDKPEENGLPYDELESLLDSIPARKKLMLIDACHSGEVDKDDLVALNATDTKLIKGLKPVAYKKEGQLGLKNSFELMQSLFVNVGKSTGATIISAAAGTQFALEGVDNLPNGVFTYSILEAMNKYPTMKISELKKIVGDRVVEITKGLQKPTSRNETIAVDWEIW